MKCKYIISLIRIREHDGTELNIQVDLVSQNHSDPPFAHKQKAIQYQRDIRNERALTAEEVETATSLRAMVYDWKRGDHDSDIKSHSYT